MTIHNTLNKRKSNPIDNSEYRTQIIEIIKTKDNKTPYSDIATTIKEQFGIEINERQLRYYRTRYVQSEGVISEMAKKEIEGFGKLVDVIAEQKKILVELQERLIKRKKIEKQMGEKTLHEIDQNYRDIARILKDIEDSMIKHGYIETIAKVQFDITKLDMKVQKMDIDVGFDDEQLIAMGDALLEIQRKRDKENYDNEQKE